MKPNPHNLSEMTTPSNKLNTEETAYPATAMHISLLADCFWLQYHEDLSELAETIKEIRFFYDATTSDDIEQQKKKVLSLKRLENHISRMDKHFKCDTITQSK